ncbi:LPXTG-motif cell wall anchor domain protein, putative [Talaromyces stipitatus ATCC 10500]|uniref:LPXTG-motif cell wall anchor domain protein, putative n=1 Tax=Talaromyces stipitatus (strain ATCC 10500 / CBS 375.48 / QM 6759 / NRRL 1006) TaxID=441959 RepID=B8M6R2_TALSN|nr:LPXTG-motif cell wall anchor domain protein, putative [Talaromyces stipitatus ATCC 10500]EED20132.1 LPXTG-motif cell wall anchor domain protein, putative [Talaromyces stipitatus ATCC 10500]
MSAMSPSALAAVRLDLESDPNWTRPRRQTNPDLIHRPSVLLRQATRRSADVSTLQNSPNHNYPSSPLADQRPRTSGSITHTSVTSSSATVTPTKRTSTSSHRSSLSASALSNPALAEIPSRKYNALRLSTGSIDGFAENTHHQRHNNLGGEPCAAPRDPAATNAPATSTFNSPNSVSNYPSYFSQASPGSETVPPSSASSSTTKRPLTAQRLGSATSPSVANSSAFNDRLLRPPSKQASTPQTARSNNSNSQNSPSIDAVLKNKSILKKAGSSADMASPSRHRRESTPLSPRSAATANNLRGDGAYDDPAADEQKDYSTDDTRSRSDDVFLNIAKSSVNSRRNSLGKMDRRRKLGLSGISTRSSLAKEQTPSPEQLKYQSSPLYPQSASQLFNSNNYSTPLSAASAHPLDDSSRLRRPSNTAGSRSVVGMPRSRYNQETSPESPHIDFKSSLADARLRYSQISNQSSRTVRQSSTSDAAERARLDGEKAKHDGTTESTLSTTAPSTVWDELDDLKSRIRKLELTGKFPSSSAAAMSNVSGERPRTAATTATTLSSSPKQKHTRKSSISPEVMAGAAAPSSIQSLLQSALAKAKTAVGPEVYNALEATATDALTLTNMLASSTTVVSGNSSTVTGSGLSERQAKRKADGLCRGLTEVCLALTEEQTITQPSNQQQPQEQIRPRSRRQASVVGDNSDAVSSISTRFRRSMSHEPETTGQQDSGLRTFSRLEGNRANTINYGSVGRRERLSHDETAASPRTPSLAAPSSRLHRLSGSHRVKREEDSDDRGSVFSRTITSRAMTEAEGYSTDSPSARYATPYQQTLSQPAKASPSLSSSIAQRRSYATPPSAGSGIPTASSLKIQPGFRRYGASMMAERGASEPPGQITSAFSPTQGLPQTRISAPSSKMATSYTAIQQPRLRNETLGSRRLLRMRPSMIGTNNDH